MGYSGWFWGIVGVETRRKSTGRQTAQAWLVQSKNTLPVPWQLADPVSSRDLFGANGVWGRPKWRGLDVYLPDTTNRTNSALLYFHTPKPFGRFKSCRLHFVFPFFPLSFRHWNYLLRVIENVSKSNVRNCSNKRNYFGFQLNSIGFILLIFNSYFYPSIFFWIKNNWANLRNHF